ncbi:alpha-amylase family glycosyl hydrolase [Paenibacillus hexagrammi]|uniref:Glycosyl hydrolase family 13 catalytic domain-containing protein n=1 Tax=Paenibacillus hexagrammi TaxID=2908839 RepID=A0ABY3SLC7_9BACL|nr:alpha-amylase family glycosyl hydrolase [Paenibacillus sp. YPD9-1]UJF34859.1 hypothetical protein L0M14_06815 [Paenibacillus sp. YPD9-1]
MSSKVFKGFVSVSLLGSMLMAPAISPADALPKVLSAQKAEAATTLPANTKDGVILHAFDWSFNQIRSNLSQIAAAGYKAVQVSPVQGTKNSSTDPSQWWLLYQPTNQSVGNAQLGSLSDFTALCTEADSYGIKIIVDVVMNHMANNGNPDQLDAAVDASFKDSSFYHNQGQASNWNNRYEITQKGIGMPDLNTQNAAVQNKALTFLNQLADAGAGASASMLPSTLKRILVQMPINPGRGVTGPMYWGMCITGPTCSSTARFCRMARSTI